MSLSDVNNVIVERYSYDVFGEQTIYDPNVLLRTFTYFFDRGIWQIVTVTNSDPLRILGVLCSLNNGI